MLAATLALALAAAASAVAAQDQPTTPSRVTAVDGTGDSVQVAVLRATYDPDRSDVTVSEDGGEVAATVTSARERGLATEIVYVVDVDNRNVANGVLSAFAAGIDDATVDLVGSVEVGIVAAGREPELVSRLTTDRLQPGRDLRAVEADRGTALYDAVALAAEAFSDTEGVVRTVVVLAGGPDTASEGAIGDAESALLQRGVQLITVAAGAADTGLDQMAERTGGVSLIVPLVVEDGEAIASVDPGPAVMTAATMAADRLLVVYESAGEPGQRPNVVLDLGGEVLSFSYPVGVLTTNALQLAPNRAGPPKDPGLFGQPVVLYVSVLFAFAAISTGLWALGSMYAGGDTSLDKVLARYSERDETLDEADVQEMLVQTALIRRAIDLTENFAERRGFLTRVEELLERANLPVRAGEAMFFLSLVVIAVFGGVALFSGSIFIAALIALVAAGAGYAGIQLAAKRRLKAFEAQLPDTLQLLAGTLRAGYSLPQGLDAVSIEIADPMGHELRRAITEAQLGRELEDALANIAERLDSPDFAWAVMAIGIQREVGGNLAEVLLTVAETMIQRERLRREVAALTAEGRVSAGILSMLPPGLGVVMWVMNPDYVGVLFSRTIGLVLVGLAVVSGLIGLAWMKKVITIDA